MPERKVLPHFRKSISGRAVTGIYSVMGNVDSYADVAVSGMFTKTVAERKDQIFHLWQHDFDSPAIAVVKDLRELRQDELPDAIKSAYPEATGGEEVTREYLETPRGEEILKGHVAGVPYQMSFAFDPVKFDLGEQDGVKVRFLREVRLYETSDVLWGANNATIASKRAPTTKMISAALRALKSGDMDMRAIWEAQDECYDLAGGASAFSSVAYLLAGECSDAVASAPLIAALRMLLSFLENEIADVEAQITAGTATDMQLMALPGIRRQLKTLKAGNRHSSTDYDLIDSIGAAVVDLGARNIALIDPNKAAPPPTPESRAETVSLTLEKARLFLLDYA